MCLDFARSRPVWSELHPYNSPQSRMTGGQIHPHLWLCSASWWLWSCCSVLLPPSGKTNSTAGAAGQQTSSGRPQVPMPRVTSTHSPGGRFSCGSGHPHALFPIVPGLCHPTGQDRIGQHSVALSSQAGASPRSVWTRNESPTPWSLVPD